MLSSEENLQGSQSEARQLKSSIKKYETLLEKYKKKVESASKNRMDPNRQPSSSLCLRLVHLQVQQARLESDEYRLKLEMLQEETREAKVSLEQELERVRRELLGRLRELEALPEKLRRTEQQLRDAQQEADAHQRRNLEHSSALSDVRHRVCTSLYQQFSFRGLFSNVTASLHIRRNLLLNCGV